MKSCDYLQLAVLIAVLIVIGVQLWIVNLLSPKELPSELVKAGKDLSAKGKDLQAALDAQAPNQK